MNAADLLQIWVNPTKVSDHKAFGLTPSTVSFFVGSLHGLGQSHGGQERRQSE